MPEAGFHRRPAKLSESPRKVRGGIKLKGKEGPLVESWVGRRWMRAVENAAPIAAIADGVEYATLGQTRTLEIGLDGVHALVQGRAPRAYKVSITLEQYGHAEWDKIIAAIADEPALAARIVAGEMPVNIEDIFASFSLRLFPSDDHPARPTCSTCGDDVWCKHVVCACCLVAERLEENPFLIFELRGMSSDEVLERLRQRRALSGAVAGAAPAYTQRPPASSDEEPTLPLDACLDRFWVAGDQLQELDTSIRRPEVSHALLRRLGLSPFKDARFPLVGLLATCYDTMSEAVQQDASGEADEAD